MKAKRFLYSLLLILVASFFAIQPAFAITRSRLEMFVENNIMFWDPDDTGVLDCQKASVGLVDMSNSGDIKTINAATVWNWFATANISGVSDSPEVIAGILGNLHQETDYINPFKWGGEGHGYGIYKASGERAGGFRTYVEQRFGDMWDKPLTSIDSETIKKAIEAELEYLTSPSHEKWNAKSDYRHFVNRLNDPTNKTGEEGAAAYAELFMIMVEIPANSDTKSKNYFFEIDDPGVKSVEYNSFRFNKFWSFGYEKNPNGDEARRRYWARHYYNLFTQNSTNLCYSTIPDSSVTVLTDGLVSNSDLASFPGAEIYSGLSLYEGVRNKINDLSSRGKLRDNVVLAFNIDNVSNNEEELQDLVSSLDSKTVYVLIPKETTNTPTLALINSQIANKSNLNALEYSPGNGSTSAADAIINEFSSANPREQGGNQSNNWTQPYTGPDIILCPKGTKTVTTGYGESLAADDPTNATKYAGMWAGAYIDGKDTTVRLCGIPGTSASFAYLTKSYIGTWLSKNKHVDGWVCIKEENGSCDYSKSPLRNTVVVYPEKDDGIVNPNTAVFSSSIAGSMLEFINHLKDLLDITGDLTTNSSLRTYELQKVIHAVNPYYSDDNWTWKDVGRWSGAGSEKTSSHVSGNALDLLNTTIETKYNSLITKTTSKLYKYVNSLNKEKGKCPAAAFNWSTRGASWNKPFITDFMCYLLAEHGLKYTVATENWHISR